MNKYNVNPSLWGIRGTKIGHIGVVAHELGHVLGLPDLYDGGSGNGIGSYGLMGNSWGFDGSQYYPPIMSPWSKMQVGWIEPKMIDSDGTFAVEASGMTEDIYRIDLGIGPHASEYLLIENRQSFGFDAKLPQGGLAIWHIDEDAKHRTPGFPGQSGWPTNANHYRVALLQADGGYHLERRRNRGDAGDLFHGDSVSSIGPSITLKDGPFPNTDSYQGGTITRTGVRIDSISKVGTRMTFSVTLGSKAPSPTKTPTPRPTKSPTPRPTMPPTSKNVRELSTTFRGGNGASGSMFDVLPLRNVRIIGMDIHVNSNSSLLVEVWTKLGTHVSFETNESAWTKIASTEIQGQGLGHHSPLPQDSFRPVPMIANERRAFYVSIRRGGGVRYTNGKGVGTLYSSNEDLQVFEGVGKSHHFGRTFTNRQWNGVIHYVLDTGVPIPVPTDKPTAEPTQTLTRPPTVPPTPLPTGEPPMPTDTSEIETTFIGGSEQAGNMFDMVAFKNIMITGMEIHTSSNSEVTVEIWTKRGSHIGFEKICSAWTKVGMATVLGMGRGNPTPLPSDTLDPVPISRYTVQAFYVTINTSTGKGMRYTRGRGRGKVVAYDGTVALLEGVGKSYPCGNTFLNRIFNGVLHYVVSEGSSQTLTLQTPAPTTEPTMMIKELMTTFVGRNQAAGNMFDVSAKTDITVVGMRLNIATTNEVSFQLWTKNGTYVGYEKNPAAWTKIATGSILGNGLGQQSPIHSGFDAISIGQGVTQAFYVTLTVELMRYTDGQGLDEAGSNSDLTISKGVGKSYPFATTYDDRVWNGVLSYVLAN